MELLRRHSPDKAILNFSKHLEGKILDVVTANALFYVAHPSGHAEPAKELLSRTIQTKKHINFCFSQMTNFVLQKLRNKVVVVHPLAISNTAFLKNAKSIRFIHADQSALQYLPVHKLEYYKPLAAAESLDNANLVLLEPEAVTKEGIFVKKGGRLLAELAAARGIPVYAVATAWHVVPKWHTKTNNEIVPAGLVLGILSEHGVYSHKDFIANVKKDFQWII
ncbi:MAG: hypothetical protein QXX65_00075 [Candidatus Woesearchaeota archaeon]